MREFELLQHIYDASAKRHRLVQIGPGDDMAAVKVYGEPLLAAVDQIVDGRHVDLNRTPIELVGRKAMTRSLSDVAAMAGVPIASLAAATLPPDFGADRATALFDAMRETAEQYDCPIVGGDIAFHRDPGQPMVCSVTVLAVPYLRNAITRSGAKVGDVVCVTGPLGGSLQPDGLGHHLTFEPRISLAQQIAQTLGDHLHAMIDISDGLGRDASHIAEMSGVQIHLHADRIPCNPGCDWKRAMSDGEDYELCFTAASPAPQWIAGTLMIEIGHVVARDSHDARLVVVQDGEELLSADELGWQHDASTPTNQ